jgi:succinate-semialdehyde dehydrogenase/glutarate-semialdehyde dehydrogenase
VILKHASIVQGCAALIEKCVRNASGDRVLLQNLTLDHEQSAHIIADRRVRGVTFTGSTDAGRGIAQLAGQNLKKSVLELGGSDAYVVFSDCDFDKTVETCVTARLVNSGQSCVAGKRFIVEESIYDRFQKRFSEIAAAKKIGDPMTEGTDVGPLSHKKLRDDIQVLVDKSVAQGARLLSGGKTPPGPGFFYPVTVLGDVGENNTAFQMEIFGPVASLVRAKDRKEAIRLANATQFGLGGALFTQNVDEGLRIIEQDLQAGFVVLNDYVKSDPRLPFGGVKESGVGRELSQFGLYEFLNIQTVAQG